jgi:tRNA threonylcarbamoyladenosine biosynthesis protein TsaB
MKILALDTATEACSVALWVDGQIVAREMEFERGHAEHVLSMVDAVLAEARTVLASLDAIAFGRGPGGFTGVRLAASVTQGLAFGAGLPVVPVSDLMAVAQRAFDLEPTVSRVLVCNDARMNEVYWACFRRDIPREPERGPREGASGDFAAAQHRLARATAAARVADADSTRATRETEPTRQTEATRQAEATGASIALVGAERVGPPASVALPEEWTGAASGAAEGVIGAAGRGFRAYAELRSKLTLPRDNHPPLVQLISDDILPRAHEIARLAVAEVRAGRVLAPENAMPVYLRDDVARPPPS